MLYKRILVLGNCGSGKTTFALKLGALTGLPNIHLDKLYWKPGWTEPTREAFDAILKNALVKETWIIDGNYKNTLPLRLQYCDQIIYFDLPRIICLWGIISRSIKHHGRNRPDVGDGCPEKMDLVFIRHVWYFEKSQGASNKKLIQSSGIPIVTFRTRRDARNYIKTLI